ncbi:MAG: LuxR C-terminal-related transcriptional regulator, partial [Verrucomicrobium sp.]
MHDELLFGIRALKVGASGYVHKEEAASQLALAVRQVLAGDYFLSPKLLEHVVHITRHSAPAAGTWTDVRALERLTDREMEVFHWLGQGLGSSQIARQLRLGLKTIETHRASIKRKLEAGSSAAMVQLAMQWREIENKSASAHFWMKN